MGWERPSARKPKGPKCAGFRWTRRARTVDVYRPAEVTVVTSDGALDGEDVLPGFRLPLREVFKAV